MIWFKQARFPNIPVSWTIMKETAEEIARKMNIKFVSSNEWIGRIKKKKKSFRLGKLWKVNAKVSMYKKMKARQTMLSYLISGYLPLNIFNMGGVRSYLIIFYLEKLTPITVKSATRKSSHSQIYQRTIDNFSQCQHWWYR